MNSKIQIYQTNITPDRNALVENIQDYLAYECETTYYNGNFQYLKLGVDIPDIIINADQSVIPNHNIGNYVRIEEDGAIYYYFIMSADWVSRSAVKLNLSIDSINTFANDLEFTDKTNIIREHDNRFSVVSTDAAGNKLLVRRINRVDEGVNTHKLGVRADYPTIGESGHFYLIYKTRIKLSPENYNNPISCFLAADESEVIAKAVVNQPDSTISGADLPTNAVAYYTYQENPTMRLWDAGQHAISMGKWDEENHQVRAIRLFYNAATNKVIVAPIYYQKDEYGDWQYYALGEPSIEAAQFNIRNTRYAHMANITEMGNVAAKTVWDINEQLKLPKGLIKESGSLPALTIGNINDIDRTDSRLMKIIELPYSPVALHVEGGEVHFDANWNLDQSGLIRLDGGLTTEFQNYIGDIDLSSSLLVEVPASQLIPDVRKDMKLESKLYNSNFHTYKAVYDSFFKEIKLENIGYNKSPSAFGEGFSPALTVNFKATNTMNSKFVFRFDGKGQVKKEPNTVFIAPHIREEADYDRYMIISRNNELPIYSSDYVNYIRSGYNYDQKAHSYELKSNIISAVAGTAGGVGSTLAAFNAAAQEKSAILGVAGFGGAISTAVKTVSSGVDTYFNNQSFINNMEEKLDQLAHQAANVSGADDIDLLKWYNKDKLQLLEYDTIATEKKFLFDLFYYFGYKVGVHSVPHLDTRYWFNFIQCEPVFKDKPNALFNIYLNDIKERFKLGITVYHRHERPGQSSYDWEQEYENWENYILEA